VSQQIIALERGLGVQLLKRSNKFVGLTTSGELFLQCARQVIDNLDRGSGNARRSVEDRFGAPVDRSARSFLPPSVSECARRVSFPLSGNRSISYYRRSRFNGCAAHRELDLALLPFPPKQQSLGMVQLGRDELVAIVAPSHHRARCDRLHANELKGQPLDHPEPREQALGRVGCFSDRGRTFFS
jgi:DNA-binding transcriptional LysR family regulator